MPIEIPHNAPRRLEDVSCLGCNEGQQVSIVINYTGPNRWECRFCGNIHDFWQGPLDGEPGYSISDDDIYNLIVGDGGESLEGN